MYRKARASLPHTYSYFRFRVSGLGFWVPGSGFRVPGSGSRVSGSGFWISDIKLGIIPEQAHDVQKGARFLTPHVLVGDHGQEVWTGLARFMQLCLAWEAFRDCRFPPGGLHTSI